MELAEGTLHDDIRIDHTLSGNPGPALFDILNGLEELARRGFIHRDLKPQNVLKIRNPGGTFRYAISDFGLMRPIGSETTTLTATGVQGGTQNYAAPELMQDFSRATIAADIYSFGAILHDIFVAQPRIPFTQLTAAGGIGKIIERCTKTNAARRYKNIAEVREDLFSAFNSGPISFHSSREQKAVELLSEARPLTSEEWDEIFIAIENNDTKNISNRNIYKALRIEHIIGLSQDSPELTKSIGIRFSEDCFSGSFDFDYCDILSARLDVFYSVGDIELRAIILLALLQLGVSHNRWLVERNFYARASITCDPDTMNRFIIEASVRNYALKHPISHLCLSIGVSRENLHPALRETLI